MRILQSRYSSAAPFLWYLLHPFCIVPLEGWNHTQWDIFPTNCGLATEETHGQSGLRLARPACPVCGQAAEHPALMTTNQLCGLGLTVTPGRRRTTNGRGRHAIMALMGWECVVNTPKVRSRREQKERDVRCGRKSRA
jgi:hypothetical protein